jgi:RNA polymerase sigma-70 factor (sigma-E family)
MIEEFVTARGPALRRFGYALTGDWALAQDLLQAALAKAYIHWPLVRGDNHEAYVRKIMLNTWVSWQRRRSRGELPTAKLPEAAGPDDFATVDSRQALRTALAKLPPRQRAVVVLRYHEDLSERQVADLLGITVGTVKSQAAQALARLRAEDVLAPYAARVTADDDQIPTGGPA